MVRVKFLDNDKKTYRFIIENTDTVYLNTLRRSIGYRLPIYAIEDIEFFENDSGTIDEMLANRIALTPINTPLVNTGKKVTFTLEKEGPGVVYSKDLISSDHDIKVTYDTIPLTKLNKNDKLKIQAYATLGTGHDHVKYSPAIISYSQMYELETKRGCDGCKACVTACPRKCIEMKNEKPILKNAEMCDGCVACIDSCKKECLKLNGTSNYILNVELIGQTNIKELFELFERYNKEYISVFKKKLK